MRLPQVSECKRDVSTASDSILPGRCRRIALCLKSRTPDHPNRSKLQVNSLGWEGHGHSICLPCAGAAHPCDLAVRNFSARPRRGATSKRRRSLRGRSLRRRPFRRRSLWRRALFRQTLRREPRGRALRLAALRVGKALCPTCGIRSVLYSGYCAPSGVWLVELLHASARADHSADCANASLVSGAIPSPPRRSSFFRFFSRAPASSWFLPLPASVLFFLRMLLQRHEGGMLLRTMVAAAFVLRRL